MRYDTVEAYIRISDISLSNINIKNILNEHYPISKHLDFLTVSLLRICL